MLTTLFLLALPAHATECPEATRSAQVDEMLQQAEQAWRDADSENFTVSLDSALWTANCLGEPISKQTAARFHQLKGVAAILGRDIDGGRRSFAAARRIDPTLDWSERWLPEGHAIYTTWDSTGPDEAQPLQLARPADASTWVDGSPSTAIPSASPAWLQLVSPDGVVSMSHLAQPGAMLPAYATAEPVAASPQPVSDGAPLSDCAWGTANPSAVVATMTRLQVQDRSWDVRGTIARQGMLDIFARCNEPDAALAFQRWRASRRGTNLSLVGGMFFPPVWLITAVTAMNAGNERLKMVEAIRNP